MTSALTLFPMGEPKKSPFKRTPLHRTPAAKPQFTQEQIQKIYAQYPRHKAPGDAYAAIEQALNAIDDPTPFESLLAIVKEYAESDEGSGPKEFIPYPATWFRRKSYLEDPSEWRRTR